MSYARASDTCGQCRKLSVVRIGDVRICPRCDGGAAMVAVKNEAKRKEEER